MPNTQIQLKDLTPALALQWLVANDREGALYWATVSESDLVEAVRDNLESFEYESQQGSLIIVKDETTLITREQFMAFYRSESYDNLLSPDDKQEIFIGALQGEADLTKELLEELCAEYSTSLEAVLEEN
jgi:hypothetical protein